MTPVLLCPDCAELRQWDNRTKLLFLAASLRGQARTFYMSLSPVDRRTYQSLTHKLDQRFGSSKHKNRWLLKLEMRKTVLKMGQIFLPAVPPNIRFRL
jgi:hypothetical protein